MESFPILVLESLVALGIEKGVEIGVISVSLDSVSNGNGLPVSQRRYYVNIRG